jgi:ADP-ribose pyrophosphatase YjhB (NUDIX family)
VECRVHRLVADVAVFAGDATVLVRYRDVSRYDGQRGWFLPDDVLGHVEHPADGARRIVHEQLGLDVEPRLDHIESFGDGAWHLIFHFRADVQTGAALTLGGNVHAAEWFDLDRLPADDEMAHGGWGSEVLRAMRAGTA